MANKTFVPKTFVPFVPLGDIAIEDNKFALDIYERKLGNNKNAEPTNQDLNTKDLSDKIGVEPTSKVFIPKRFTGSTVNDINNVYKSKEELREKLKKEVLDDAKYLFNKNEPIGDAFKTYMNSISESTKGYKRKFGLKSKKWRDAYKKVYGKTRYRYNKTEYEGGKKSKKSKKSRRKSKRKN